MGRGETPRRRVKSAVIAPVINNTSKNNENTVNARPKRRDG